MIKIFGEASLNGIVDRPYFICDWCKKRIIANGVCLYNVKNNKIFYAHGGNCHDKLQDKTGCIYWDRLSEFLKHLSANYLSETINMHFTEAEKE